MTEHFKAAEKIQLSEEEIANLSDAQFKTLVIRMLTDLVEYGHKLEEKNEGYAKWNKPGTERQMPYDLIDNWNPRNKII